MGVPHFIRYEIHHTKCLAGLGGKKTSEHKNYTVLTYDDVVEEVCQSYVPEFGAPHT